MELSIQSMARMQERGIATHAIEIGREHRRRIHCAGAVFCSVGRRDLPEGFAGADCEKLEGLTLVLSPDDDTVATVYRNKMALREIRQKKRYDRMNRYIDKWPAQAMPGRSKSTLIGRTQANSHYAIVKQVVEEEYMSAVTMKLATILAVVLASLVVSQLAVAQQTEVTIAVVRKNFLYGNGKSSHYGPGRSLFRA